jgi:Flp pilus assembly secretin CpaC
MRYLLFLAAVLASAPAYAQDADTIVLSPGSTVKYQAPKPFKHVYIGNPDILDVVQGQTNRQLIITKKPVDPTKPGGGTTNVLLLDENGDRVANVLVTNPGLKYDLAQSPSGIWQVYRQAPPSP